MFSNTTKIAGLIAAGAIALGLSLPATAEKEVHFFSTGDGTAAVADGDAKAFTIQSFGGLASGGFLGVHLEEVTEETVDELGLREEYGAHLTKIVEDSPAAKAGLEADDVVLTWNGTRVESAAQFQRLVKETPAGRTVQLSVFRDSNIINVPVEIGTRQGGMKVIDLDGGDHDFGYIFGDGGNFAFGPDMEKFNIKIEGLDGLDGDVKLHLEEALRAQEEALAGAKIKLHALDLENIQDLRENAEAIKKRAHEIRIQSKDGNDFVWFSNEVTGKARLGVTLQSLTDQLAEYFGVEDRGAVLVASVAEGSPAEAAGLKAGDVILAVDGKDTESVDAVMKSIRGMYGEGDFNILVMRDKRPESIIANVPEEDNDQ